MTPRVDSGEAAGAAFAGGAERVWLVAPSVLAPDEALAPLEAAMDTHGAALAAGLVCSPDGRPVLLPGAPEGDPERIITLATARVLPLRWTPLVHVLIARAAVERCGPPDGLRWSARVLRERPGVLVPGSRAQLVGDPPAFGPREALAARREGALTTGEALRLALRR